tara:strand:+ start:3753 stop:4421 length:669 start_codon:yes stop_codon:yes gene_type:complete
MAPLPFTEIPANRRRQLLQIARTAIARRLQPNQRMPECIFSEEGWNRLAACFVTLHQGDSHRLRGCIGTLKAELALTHAVAYYAEQAAFEDPRFDPLTAAELLSIEIEISLLSPLTELLIGSEAELLQSLRPGIDGLWLQAGSHRATFLPQVWQQLADPVEFVVQLKLKAGLAKDHWDQSFRCWRYSVESFSESDPALRLRHANPDCSGSGGDDSGLNRGVC